MNMDYFNDFLHSRIGIVRYRQSLKMRKDPFFQYIPNDNPRDNEIVRRLCTHYLTNICFKRCVTPKYPVYTYEEEECVQKCVQDYFSGFETMITQTQRKINQPPQE